ncbi:probable WRKY transcription factor 41 [Cynara cardunculus var. scolymus]|uniref:probable WRKY transcription factor 41 n=1 Tax=Cynara cardunculus var. scolymus TaxID=59895 RepID=UPI000D62D679|nr:probable WRKY transcription factor 41 [Cynara cardunculus var. scolymus]
MDTACVSEQNTVIHELTQGIQMAKQLRSNLNSPQVRDFLIHNILSSYDKILLVLKSADSAGPPTPGLLDSPISGGSLQSGGFEFGQLVDDQLGQNVVSRKRKASTEWEDQVRISTDDGLEGKTDDGYNWRKYGQKLILGSKYPRSYYRCTYRKAKNCLATKQVQRTDEVPAVFEIAYKGKHTCNHGPTQSAAPSPASPEKHEIEPPHHYHHHHHHHHHQSSPNPSEVLSDFKANLSVNTTDLGATDPSSFSFSPTPFGILESCQELLFPNHFDDELLQGYSPPFISPATSELNLFSDWNSLPMMDFPTDPEDTFSNYKFSNSYLLEGCSLR